MAGCLRDVQADARELVDLRAWAREKPWWTVGIGAGAGFLAGRALFSAPPAPDGVARRRMQGRLGALIAPLAVPLVGMAIRPLLRALGPGTDDDGLASSPLQRVAFGPILTALIKRLA